MRWVVLRQAVRTRLAAADLRGTPQSSAFIIVVMYGLTEHYIVAVTTQLIGTVQYATTGAATGSHGISHGLIEVK